MYPVAEANFGKSSRYVKASCAGFSKIPSIQLFLAGAVKPAKIKYFTTNANPNIPPKLCRSFFASNAANRLFQSVQKKQKAITQNGKPFSGRSELKICAEAAKSVSKTVRLATFFSAEKRSENQPSSRIRLARKKSASRLR